MAEVKKQERVLIIVESPTKVKTLKQFLPSNYVVVASVGHICKINDSGDYNMGIDPKNNFKFDWVISPDKVEVVRKLKEQVKAADRIVLASDPDREGEAISYHLKNFLNISDKNYDRVTYHEITKKAVLEALNNPRKIDLNYVYAALNRSAKDKIVGYRVSTPARNAVGARSVGNCQSPGLGLIVDLEEEIENFKSETYFDLFLHFFKNNVEFKAKYTGTDSVDIKSLPSLDSCKKIVGECKKGQYDILDINKKDSFENPKPPFTTSTFQQEVSKKLGISVKDCMDCAQKLFEGIDVNHNHIALITYIRTDDACYAPEFLPILEQFVKDKYGKDYYAPVKFGKKGETAQEGHEGIRVLDLEMTPEKLSKYVTNTKLLKVYDIIYKRTIASSMKPAVIANTIYTIENGKHRFTMNSKELRFDGYRKVYSYQDDTKDDSQIIKETFNKNEVLQNTSEEAIEKHTTPPTRYTEASFLKDLDKKGIGRPSTYATIINTILDEKRGYCKLVDKYLVPTDLGIKLVHFLKKNFPSIVDPTSRATMEKDLDKIANGKLDYIEDLTKFYSELETEINKISPGSGEERICPDCGKPLSIRKGRYGLFWGCTGYPNCKHIESMKKKTD